MAVGKAEGGDVAIEEEDARSGRPPAGIGRQSSRPGQLRNRGSGHTTSRNPGPGVAGDWPALVTRMSRMPGLAVGAICSVNSTEV